MKIEAEDVVLSEAIKLAIIALPALWLTYAFLLLLFSGLAAKTVFFILLSFPLMSYIGVISAEAGMIAIKDLQPLFNLARQLRKDENWEDIALMRYVASAAQAHGNKFGGGKSAYFAGKWRTRSGQPSSEAR